MLRLKVENRATILGLVGVFGCVALVGGLFAAWQAPAGHHGERFLATHIRAARRAVAASAVPCSANDLKLSAEDAGGGMGIASYLFSFQNLGSVSCSIEGYPTMRFLNSSGQPYSVSTVTVGGGIGSSGYGMLPFDVAATTVTIDPGGWASFYSAYNTQAPGCSLSSAVTADVEVAPPGSSQFVSGLPSNLNFAPCAGVAYVTAVYPGTSLLQPSF